MNGRIESAQELLEQAAYEWQRAKHDLDFCLDFDKERNSRDRIFENAGKQLDQAINRLRNVTNQFLREKGSIP